MSPLPVLSMLVTTSLWCSRQYCHFPCCPSVHWKHCNWRTSRSNKTTYYLADARLLIKWLRLDPNPALIPLVQKEILLLVTLLLSAPLIRGSPAFPHFLTALFLAVQPLINGPKTILFLALLTMTLPTTVIPLPYVNSIPSAPDPLTTFCFLWRQ